MKLSFVKELSSYYLQEKQAFALLSYSLQNKLFSKFG